MAYDPWRSWQSDRGTEDGPDGGEDAAGGEEATGASGPGARGSGPQGAKSFGN